MSVLIKGMEMPNDCNKCQLLEGYICDGFCHGANKWLDSEDFVWEIIDEEVLSDKPVNCPLIEVPTPHGRLIDADSLKKDDTVRFFHSARFKDIDEAPTIIEAEGNNDISVENAKDARDKNKKT